jgi:hypothetical protein
MKIGSFDPGIKLKEVQKYEQKYWADNIVLIQRSTLFLVLNVLQPLFWYIIMYISVIMIAIYGFNITGESIVYRAIIWFSAVIVLYTITHSKRLIDHLYDFIIVTPRNIISYNQTGIRKRQNRTIDCEKVKTISVNYRNRIFSIFHNGDITFLSEGDAAANGGEIYAYYVHHPQKTRDRIYEIIQKKRKSL